MPFEAEIRSCNIELRSYEEGEHKAKCPNCRNRRKPKNASAEPLSIKIEPGKWYGKCHNCGEHYPPVGFKSGRKPAGNGPAEFYAYKPDLRKGKIRRPGQKPVVWWEYRDAAGTWLKTKGPHDLKLLLYRLDEAKAAAAADHKRIAVVEGESDADACWRAGVPAICSAHGASEDTKRPKWYAGHSDQLRELDIVVFNDNDPPGYAHADTTCRLSLGIANVYRLDLKDHWGTIPHGGDVRAWLNGNGGTPAGLRKLVDEAPPYQPSASAQPVASSAPPWLQLCIMSDGRFPRPLSVFHNACLGLDGDQTLSGKLSFDEMAAKSVLTNSDAKFVEDDDIAVIQSTLQTAGLKTLSRDITAQAIDHVARKKKFHPLRDHLNELEWDGIERIDEFLPTYFGTANSDYERKVGRWFLIQMMARVFEPGCKADYMLILEGPQGVEKSKACAALAGEKYYSDNLPDLTNAKDVSVHLRGKLLIEVSELHAFSKADANLLKQFLSRQVERYRPPYGRMEVDEPRQCVFIGTSNKDAYLRDDTGGRRFWPVKCGTILVEAIKTDRDQLLAEALYAYRHGEKPWPDGDFEREHIRPQQASRYEADIWSEKLEEHLAGILPGETVTVRQLAKDALFIEDKLMDSRTEKRIVSVLQSLGYSRGKSGATRYWVKPVGH